MSKGQVLAHAKSRTAPQTPTETRRSVRQEVFEKARHGHLVLFIGAHFRGVLRLGERMRRAAVQVDLEIHLGGAELRNHGVELIHRRNWVFGAVQNRDAAVDVLRGFRREVSEPTVYGEYPEKRRAGFDELDPHG